MTPDFHPVNHPSILSSTTQYFFDLPEFAGRGPKTYYQSWRQLLTSPDPAITSRLDELFPAGKDISASWYPSAGNDYRDLMYLSDPLARTLGLAETPDIYIHTDYFKNWVRLGPGVVHRDERTCITILSRHRVELALPVRYQVSQRFVDFPDEASPEPEVWLMDVEVTSRTLGVLRKPVIYFMFENINFLSEVLLRHRLPVSHLVKVREGCGFGGNRKCISVAYPFLKILGVRYALLDHEVHFDERLSRSLANQYRLPFERGFTLRQCGAVDNWSGFRVRAFELQPANGRNFPGVDEMLASISHEPRL